MGCKELFIWVEGIDDERFFRKILEPKLKEKYDLVKIICYATLKKEKIDDFLKSIKAMKLDYIFITDINNSPCVTAKKREIQSKLRHIDDERIVVVIKEIESWYLAGLSQDIFKKLKIRAFNNTDEITKEQFDNLIPKRFGSRIDFMLELLKEFSIEIAKQENRSFAYFIGRYDC